MNIIKTELHKLYEDQEILTEKFGEGLDGVLRNRRADLIGILNGADYQQWRTTNNKFLPSVAIYDIFL